MRNGWGAGGLAAILAFGVTSLAAATRPVGDPPGGLLSAPIGVTAISGQVVDLQGNGLPGVELSVGDSHTRSDDQGRFLLSYVIPGVTVLQIDGRHAGLNRDVDHGYYEARVEALPGRTTTLPFKSWLPEIDHRHEVTIDSPTREQVVIKTPVLPDFELRIPKGTVIRDADGKVVRRIGLTTTPPDRTPVPLPPDMNIPVFVTIQPGASCLYDAVGGVGTATLVYPNFHKELPKARAMMWRYEPDGNGWAPYGTATVSADGRQVVPDPGVVLTDFASGQCDPATQTRKPPPDRPRHDRRKPGTN